MRVRMRQAQRQMKGTKLQYIGQEPVLFSDVAGVPAAKVGLHALCDITLLWDDHASPTPLSCLMHLRDPIAVLRLKT